MANVCDEVKEEKKKKAEAVAAILPKWTNISGQELTQISLFKKINNLKSRVKLALKSGKPLSDWQNKIVELTSMRTDEDDEKIDSASSQSLNDNDNDAVPKPKKSKTDAEQLLNEFESDQTKLLNNEQLQRLVLLKQIKVLTLQQQRLESMCITGSSKDIIIDLAESADISLGANPMDII